ncbi:MAG: hypothetical protein AB1599_03370 [Planctomycetota bacterium]
MSATCLFCNPSQNLTPESVPGQPHTYKVSCVNCGDYFVTDNSLIVLRNLSSDDKIRISSYLMSRYLTEKSPVALTDTILSQKDFDGAPLVTIDEMISQFPNKVTDKLDKALLNLSKKTGHFGQVITLSSEKPAILYAINEKEFMALLNALKEMSYISQTNADALRAIVSIYITAKGFDRIYELGKVNPESRHGFVAMWFDPSMDNAYKNGFEKAVIDAGYEPRRIDKKEFVGDIDDEIIAEIRRSRFLVADFTEFRSGVFYEAGFAFGLGIPVIYTCNEKCKDKIKEHFDTRQKKHITWKDETDLYKQLKNSITANIGWGPKAKKEAPK